jgi:hypothetical protein
MKTSNLLLLALAVSIASPFATKAGNLGDTVDYYLMQDQASECKNTLNGLDKLLNAAKAVQAESLQSYKLHPNDPSAKKDYDDATTMYNGLAKWHDEVADRYNDLQERLGYMEFTGKNPGLPDSNKDSGNDSRDSAKDGATNARDASTDASRQTTSDTVRGSIDNCPPRGGCARPGHP